MLVVIAQIDRAGVVAQQAARLGQDFGQDLVEVVVGVDHRQQVAQPLGDALAPLDLVQTLLGFGAQTSVFDGQRRLLGEGLAQIDLFGAVRVGGVVVQHQRAVGLVARQQRHRGEGRVRRRQALIVRALGGIVGRRRAGPHDFQIRAAVFDLVVDGARRWVERARPRSRRRRRVRRLVKAMPMIGGADRRRQVQHLDGHAVGGLDAQHVRIVRVAQIQPDAVAAEHLVGLRDEIGQDLVEAAAGVDDGQQIAQAFGAQAATDVQAVRWPWQAAI